jgi:tetratricopeptide (TPR) repeat protein
MSSLIKKTVLIALLLCSFFMLQRTGPSVFAFDFSEVAQLDEVARLNNQGVEAYKKGEFAKALGFLERAHKLAPNAADVRQNLAVVCTAYGTERMEAGDLNKARPLFQKALNATPDSELTLKNYFAAMNNYAVKLVEEKKFSAAQEIFEELTPQIAQLAKWDLPERLDNNYSAMLTNWGNEELEKGNDDQALRLLNLAVLKNPQSGPAVAALAELYYAADDYEQAEKLYQQALKIDPARGEHFRSRLRSCREEAKFEKAATHYSDERRRFLLACWAEIDREQMALLLRQLNDAYLRLSADLEFTPRRVVRVKIYRDREFYSIHGVPQWTGGFFDGKLRLPAKIFDTGERAIRQTSFHEMTHVFLHALAGGELEYWLQEGLAQYYELDAELNDEETELLRRIVRNSYREFTQLREANYTHFTGEAAAKEAYAHAEGFVRYLVEKHKFRRMKKLLEEIRQGADTEQAIQRAYGTSLEDLHEAWRAWGRRNY